MRKIVGLLRAHIAEDFRPGYYALMAAFLVLTIGLNYRYDFEDSVIDGYSDREVRMFWYFLFYCVAYYAAVGFDVLTSSGPVAYVRQPRFWGLSLAGLALLGFDGGCYYHRPAADALFAPETRAWGVQVLVNLNSLLTILLPCALLYRWHPDHTAGFFGLTTRHVDLRPYAGLLLVMVPLIGWASFQSAFLETYPAYERNEAAAVWGVPVALTALGFELAYGWDFIATELVFRGLLVIGLAHVMGRRAVLPMVATYAFLHFGKPLGETIGSVFGGYILGVIALRTRNIWGGVAIHLGVAWLMEAAAFAQRWKG